VRPHPQGTISLPFVSKERTLPDDILHGPLWCGHCETWEQAEHWQWAVDAKNPRPFRKLCRARKALENKRTNAPTAAASALKRAERDAFVARFGEHAFRRIRKYRMTMAAYAAAHAAVDGRCPICTLEPTLENPLCIDHDHACCNHAGGKQRTCGSCFRGLICSRCNSAIGLMADDVDRLKKAIGYLQAA
jgi:hypothetical protein